MKYLAYGFGALVLLGLVKGVGDIDITGSRNMIIEIVLSLLAGVRDTTVYLIPTLLRLAGEALDQIGGAGKAAIET